MQRLADSLHNISVQSQARFMAKDGVSAGAFCSHPKCRMFCGLHGSYAIPDTEEVAQAGRYYQCTVTPFI